MGFADFNEFLHTLRTKEIQKMPPGAKVMLSAGCNGRSYFDWINANYPGITRHFGIEAYLPMPSDLPEEAIWLPDYLHNIKSVVEQDVDLVFAGQTVEHLWPEELAGFLKEAYRVLKPDGWFVLDSPNRFITHAIQWFHPEHTVEFTVPEILEMLTLAGFFDIHIKGIWLCYNRETQMHLPLIPDLMTIDIETDPRVMEAVSRPEDSFVWWIEARKKPDHSPDLERLTSLIQSIYKRVFPLTLRREFSLAGEYQQHETFRTVLGRPGKPGYLRFGPYVPLQPGSYLAQFYIISIPGEIIHEFSGEAVVLKLDVTITTESKVVGEKTVTIANLKHEPIRKKSQYLRRLKNRIKRLLRIPVQTLSEGQRILEKMRVFEIPFVIENVAFGVQFRAYTTGIVPVQLKSNIELFECREQGENIRIS